MVYTYKVNEVAGQSEHYQIVKLIIMLGASDPVFFVDQTSFSAPCAADLSRVFLSVSPIGHGQLKCTY